MNKRLLIIVFFPIVAGCGQHKNVSSGEQKVQSTSLSLSTAVPEFDAAQAFSFLTAQTDFGPRNPGSQGHQRCLDYLYSELKTNSDVSVKQEFTEKGYDGEVLHLTNIFASFQPKMTERVLLLAHWDTRPRADMEKDSSKMKRPILGADDGASGVAVLLEIAKLMKSVQPPIGIDILLDDGEDYGKRSDLSKYSLGTRYFVKAKSPGYSPRFGVLLDMIGNRDVHLPMEQNSMKYAPAAVELIWSAAEELGVTQFVNVPGEEIFDDHIPLNEGGIPTVDIIDFDYPYWHTLDDTPDKCSAESLGAVGRVLTFVIYTKLSPRQQH